MLTVEQKRQTEVRLLQPQVTRALMEVAWGIVDLGKALAPSPGVRSDFQNSFYKDNLVGRTERYVLEWGCLRCSGSLWGMVEADPI